MLCGVPDPKKQQVALESQKNTGKERNCDGEMGLTKVGLKLWNSAIGAFGSDSSEQGFSIKSTVDIAFPAFQNHYIEHVNICLEHFSPQFASNSNESELEPNQFLQKSREIYNPK